MLKIHEVADEKFAEILADDVVVCDVQDALDWMATADYEEVGSLIFRETHLHPDFFDLSTGLAGEILGKFTTYRMNLAVVGDFDKYQSKSLRAFITESNRGNQIFFVPDLESAIIKLTSKALSRRLK